MSHVIERASPRAEIMQTCVPLLFNLLYDRYQNEGLAPDAVTALGWTHTAMVRSLSLQDQEDAIRYAQQLKSLCRKYNVSDTSVSAIQDVWVSELSQVAAKMYGDDVYSFSIRAWNKEIKSLLNN